MRWQCYLKLGAGGLIFEAGDGGRDRLFICGGER